MNRLSLLLGIACYLSVSAGPAVAQKKVPATRVTVVDVLNASKIVVRDPSGSESPALLYGLNTGSGEGAAKVDRLLRGHEVAIAERSRDKYERKFYDAWFRRPGGTWQYLNEQIVRTGILPHSEKHGASEVLASAQQSAQRERLGRWQNAETPAVIDDRSKGSEPTPNNDQELAEPINPEELMRKLEGIGLRVDGIPWGKSRVADYWISQMRIWNNDKGFQADALDDAGRFNNEVVAQLKGRSAHEVTEFYVEAEIHAYGRPEQMVQTLRKSYEAMKQLDRSWPESVKNAILAKRDYASGNWLVKHEGDSLTVIYRALPDWEHNEWRNASAEH